jgi:hypothetical protein
VPRYLALYERSGPYAGHPAHQVEERFGAAGKRGTDRAQRRHELAGPDIRHVALALGYGTFGLVELVISKRDHGLSSLFVPFFGLLVVARLALRAPSYYHDEQKLGRWTDEGKEIQPLPEKPG